jgi:hypothetical protein
MDTKNTKEMLKFVIGLAESMEKAMADGKMSFDDVGYLVTALMDAGPAFGEINQIPAEVRDLTTTEAQDVRNYVASELDLTNDKVEGVVEAGLDVCVQLTRLIAALRA